MSFKKTFRESESNKLVSRSILFLEVSAENSKIASWAYYLLDFLYPEKALKLIDSINRRQKSYLSRNVFSPDVVFPLLYLLFISLSNYRISNFALLTTQLT
jgi:hypothetical protein